MKEDGASPLIDEFVFVRERWVGRVDEVDLLGVISS